MALEGHMNSVHLLKVALLNIDLAQALSIWPSGNKSPHVVQRFYAFAGRLFGYFVKSNIHFCILLAAPVNHSKGGNLCVVFVYSSVMSSMVCSS